MTKIILLFFSILSVLACTQKNVIQENFSSGTAKVNADQPNILVILTDDQGYHDVSYYGTQDLRTPHIDALTSDGLRFDNFYANCPVCSPTRASLLTGRYPDRVGVPGVIRTRTNNSWGFLDPAATTLPDLSLIHI